MSVQLSGSKSLLFPWSVCWDWFMWTAPQIVLVIAQNSPCMQHCTSFNCVRSSVTFVHIFLFAPETCSCIPALMCLKPVIWRVSLHPWWASLSQMDGLSQCQRGDSWLAWPLLAKIWILSSDSSWQLLMGDTSTTPPTHELASWKLLVNWGINDVSACFNEM